jgi:glycerol-3-phosphate acyltransferase PlsY
VNETIALAVAYLFGSIPSGYIAGRMRGIDIRTVGSGNLGAANVFRNLGKKWGIAVMLADIAKGIAGVVIARVFTDDPWPVLAGAAVMAGAIFPVWLRFKGGKGVAAAAGVIIGLMPTAAALIVPFWLVVVLLTRITSVGSLAAAVGFTPLSWALGFDWPYLVLAGAMSLLVIYRHRTNIMRLAHGEEARIELRRNRPASKPEPGA